MTVNELLATLRTLGVQVRVEDRTIRLGPAHLVTDDLVHLVAIHRSEILIHGTYAEQLEQRLRAGEEMIEAETDLNERHRLENHWLALLEEYMQAVDRERRPDEQGEAA